MRSYLSRIEKEAIIRSTMEFLRSHSTEEEYKCVVTAVLDTSPQVIDRIRGELESGLDPKAVALFRRWEKNEIIVLDYVGQLRGFLTPDNILTVVNSLPPRVYKSLRRFAESWVDHDPANVVTLGHGEKVPDHPELIPALRLWLAQPDKTTKEDE